MSRQARIEHLLAKNIHPAAVLFIVALETNQTTGLTASLSELADQPAYAGRKVVLARSGITLIYNGRSWCLE